MAALVGVRHNSVLRTFSTRLLARGKPKQVALIACMHKLLTILQAILQAMLQAILQAMLQAMLQAILRHHTPWQPALLA
jgi:transposase